MRYDKDKIKNDLTIEQVYDLVAELGGEPRMGNDGTHFVSQTICHNEPGEGHHKLYYYDNTKLFKCFTDCGDTFDIFDLICRHKNTIKETTYQPDGSIGEWKMYHAILYVVNFFNIEVLGDKYEDRQKLKDWNIFDKYNKINAEPKAKKVVDLKIYDDAFLTNFPQPHISDWEKEGIKYDVMKDFNIHFHPRTYGILIPHYDIDNQLIGIRERTMIEENEKYGKYRPAIINGCMYNHPLSFALYGLNKTKDNIREMQRCILFEGEKSVLQYASHFGMENNISAACCGSNLINYQMELLLSLGVKEVTVAFDKQYNDFSDEECLKWRKKLEGIYRKYGSICQISFIMDRGNALPYKASPIDCGSEIFLDLYKERIILQNID